MSSQVKSLEPVLLHWPSGVRIGAHRCGEPSTHPLRILITPDPPAISPPHPHHQSAQDQAFPFPGPKERTTEKVVKDHLVTKHREMNENTELGMMLKSNLLGEIINANFLQSAQQAQENSYLPAVQPHIFLSPVIYFTCIFKTEIGYLSQLDT